MKSRHILFIVLLAFSNSAQADEPVAMQDEGARVVLSNGVLTAKIEKATARVISMRFRGQEMVRPGGNIYYSMDTAGEFESPKGCVFTVKTETPDVVDVGMRRVHSGQAHAVDIEIHYVLRRGDSGLYTYALLDHPASYPATTVNEWRLVWKLPDDLLERICVDDARNWVMPSAADFEKAESTPIKEVLLMTSGVRAGLYDCKYSFNANYHDLDCWGHASDQRQLGAWAVFGSHEFFNDGPTKNDLTSAAGVIHVHFGLNHYDGSQTQIAAGEAWKKIYGPLLLYCNEGKNSAAAWADAKERAARDREKWPHEWLTKQPAYPLAEVRGRVNGRFILHDRLKPELKASGAWIGLAQADAGGNWQFESKHYQYWGRATAEGDFRLEHVRPGNYTLYAFAKGAVGEFTRTNVTVKSGETTSLGDVVWDVPHVGSRIAWEIGVPDRTAREFHHGDDYFQPFIWKQFATEFSSPLDFRIGQSDSAKDWNYAQCAYLKDGKTEPWPWRIHFSLDSLPKSGNAVLTVAIASHESSHLKVFVNDGLNAQTLHRLPGAGGNALFRQGIHGKYELARIAIPISQLRTGNNTLTLLTTRHDGQANHLMYDYLSLELP